MSGAFLIYGKADRDARPELMSGASTAEGAVTFIMRMKTEYGSKGKLYVVMEVVDPRRGFEDISNMRLVFSLEDHR